MLALVVGRTHTMLCEKRFQLDAAIKGIKEQLNVRDLPADRKRELNSELDKATVARTDHKMPHNSGWV